MASNLFDEIVKKSTNNYLSTIGDNISEVQKVLESKGYDEKLKTLLETILATLGDEETGGMDVKALKVIMNLLKAVLSNYEKNTKKLSAEEKATAREEKKAEEAKENEEAKKDKVSLGNFVCWFTKTNGLMYGTISKHGEKTYTVELPGWLVTGSKTYRNPKYKDCKAIPTADWLALQDPSTRSATTDKLLKLF